MEQLKALLSLSGRMNRRSFLVNLLIVFVIGFVGGYILGLTKFSTVGICIGGPILFIAILRELTVASRRIHDVNGPTFLAFVYILSSIVAIWSPDIGLVLLFVKLLLVVIPGNKNTNKYGDKPENKIVF